jgi:hypothetical protein
MKNRTPKINRNAGARNPRRPRRTPVDGYSADMAHYTNAFYHAFKTSQGPPSAIINRWTAGPLSFVTSTTVETLTALYFTLDGVSGATEFTALYDQYRLLGVNVELFPSSDTMVGGSIYAASDYDDAAAPASVGAMTQYSSAVRFPPGKPIVLKSDKLAVDVSVFGTSGSAPGVNLRSPWIDCGKSDVQHFGIKLAATATTAVVTYTINVRYTMQFRNIR